MGVLHRPPTCVCLPSSIDWRCDHETARLRKSRKVSHFLPPCPKEGAKTKCGKVFADAAPEREKESPWRSAACPRSTATSHGAEESSGRGEEVGPKPATDKESEIGRKLHP